MSRKKSAGDRPGGLSYILGVLAAASCLFASDLRVIDAVNAAKPSTYVEVDIPLNSI